jgi:cytochrome c biogenesis protein ResB
MKGIKKILMLLALAFLVLLVILSIYSTFIGAEKAQQFFNTLPLTVYWIAFTVLMFVAIANFRRLLHEPWLFMIHAGIVVTLSGAMWSSETGHKLSEKYLNSEKTQSGYMALFQNRPDDRLMSADMRTQVGTLPFKLNLISFWIEYYRSGPATVTGVNASGKPFTFELTDEFPQVFDVDENTKLEVHQKFENFKLEINEGQGRPTDQKGLGENQAVDIEIQTSVGSSRRGYLFEKFPAMNSVGQEYNLNFSAGQITGISDYKSYVQVFPSDGGKPLAVAIIEVNKPLEIGGYHFYQYSYEPENLRYTVLAVASDSGLFSVYLGFWMLGIGIVGMFWIKPIRRFLKLNKQTVNEH